MVLGCLGIVVRHARSIIRLGIPHCLHRTLLCEFEVSCNVVVQSEVVLTEMEIDSVRVLRINNETRVSLSQLEPEGKGSELLQKFKKAIKVRHLVVERAL